MFSFQVAAINVHHGIYARATTDGAPISRSFLAVCLDGGVSAAALCGIGSAQLVDRVRANRDQHGVAARVGAHPGVHPVHVGSAVGLVAVEVLGVFRRVQSAQF